MSVGVSSVFLACPLVSGSGTSHRGWDPRAPPFSPVRFALLSTTGLTPGPSETWPARLGTNIVRYLWTVRGDLFQSVTISGLLELKKPDVPHGGDSRPRALLSALRGEGGRGRRGPTPWHRTEALTRGSASPEAPAPGPTEPALFHLTRVSRRTPPRWLARARVSSNVTSEAAPTAD